MVNKSKIINLSKDKSGETDVTILIPKFEEKTFKLSKIRERQTALVFKKNHLEGELDALMNELEVLNELIKKADGKEN